MRVLLSSRGSRGDVYPIVAIARALRARGHAVTLCLPPVYEALCRRDGLALRPYREQSEAVMQSFGSGWRAASEALRWFASSLDEQFELLGEEGRGADLLVTSVNEVAAPSVAEHLRIPHARIAYAPVLPGSQPPPLQPYQRLPAFANRALWRALNAASSLLFGARLERWRRRLGLAPIRDFGDYCAARSLNLLCLSPTLAPPDPGWRYRHRYTGYCFSEDEGPLAPELERFLADGPPPIYLGFGSTSVGDPRRVGRIVEEAVLRAGVRAIVARGWAGLATQPRRYLFPLGEAPHATLFPRLAGIAHHGGSGTLHSGARAGVPQLLLPRFADQYFWARRVELLGLGPRPLQPAELGVARLARALRELAEDPGARRRARALAAERGVETAVAILCGEPVGAAAARAACA